MEDTARKEKLAAAKKKLKKFQKTGKNSTNSTGLKNENGSSKSNNLNNSQVQTAEKRVNGKATLNSTNSPAPPSSSSQIYVQAQSPKSSKRPSNQDSLSTSSTPVAKPTENHPTLTASTERLQQLSRQVNGLISESSAFISNEDIAVANNTDVSDLEARNRELAALLQKHTQTNEQLHRQFNELKLQNGKLQAGLEAERKNFDDKLKREIGALKEQLQVHIQTIGILVSEKTELQSTLTQHQKSAEQRLEEIEELSGRLKASRQRVADLERSFTSASSSSQKHEKNSKEYSKELDRIKLELYKTNKSNEEYQQQNSELQGKLQKKISECSKVEDDLIEVKGKLEMSELFTQQLQNSGSQPDADSIQQIEKLLTEKAELTSRIDHFEEACKKLGSERDQLSQQYQEYIEQLQQQSQHLQLQITTLMEERTALVKKEQNLSATIEDLTAKQNSESSNISEIMKEKQELMTLISQLQQEVEDTKKRCETLTADNSQLSRLVMEKENSLMEMEMSVQQWSDSQVDKEQLLESMQSDKTALSRAIAQNKELKLQLAELQNGFVKMSNDNMDMMTQLAAEQHVSKELATRLSQQEDELKEIREQLVNKEVQLHELQENSENTSRTRTTSMMSENDVEEKIREFTDQAPLIESFQRELSSAQDTINALTNQNSELRTQVMRNTDGNDNIRESQGNATRMDNMSAAIKQLEAERNQVLEELRTEKQSRIEVGDALDKLRLELATQTPATLNGDVINKAQFEALQHAMKQLENKYTKAMRDKADLMDKTEQLEHIIMQLQGETDTIGEYVALYQQQRHILKERTLEKDDYIQRLARDREEMADKLGQLQAAVMQLLGERQMLHSYALSPAEGTKQTEANHLPLPEAHHHKTFGSKLDSSQLEDWPDYNSSNSDDSDGSTVEPIVAGKREEGSPHQTHSMSQYPATSPKASPTSNIPQDDQTAQRIMSLLNEIGTSNVIDRTSLSDHHFLHCNHCTGQLLNV